MEITLSPCSFAKDDDKCHKSCYKKETGLKFVSSLSETEIQILLWRTENQNFSECVDSLTICNHHYCLYLERFSENVKKTWVDPLNMHKSKKPAQGRRIISLEWAMKLKDNGILVTPGYKLFSRCMTACKAIDATNQTLMETSNDSDSWSTTCGSSNSKSDFELEKEAQDYNANFETEQQKQALNASLSLIGESPLQFHSIPKRQKPNACKRKLQKAKKSLAVKLGEAANVSVQELQKPDDDNMSKEEKELKKIKSDFNDLMSDLKVKFDSPSTLYKEKIQMLTMKPLFLDSGWNSRVL